MKRDILKRTDIELLVNSFYGKVRSNSVLGHIFDQVEQVDWESHLPIMYSFWASLLLGERSYMGNPMHAHVELSKRTSITYVEFSEWTFLFTQTVNELFEGEKAEEAKKRAIDIARLMLHKIETA